MALGAGVKVRWPAARSAALTNCPGATAAPLNSSDPAEGALVMITADRLLAGLSRGSENWKSEGANILVASSLSVTAEAPATGASFTGLTVRLTVTGADWARPSDAL